MIKKTSSTRSTSGMDFKATYYCLTGKTASGIRTRAGIVAADTKVFPLGSRILINGQQYLVADTGSRIRGNRLDIWISSCSQATKLGIKNVKVQRL